MHKKIKMKYTTYSKAAVTSMLLLLKPVFEGDNI